MSYSLVSAPPLVHNQTTNSAREYLRVSLDRSGRARSLTEQHADNARVAEAQGWALGEAYRDNSVSASRYSRKVRDGFVELMAALEGGTFGASVLMLWESSRGSRRVGEWADLIDVCAERGVSIYVTTHGRLYDPRNGRDRRTLQEDAVDSEYESSKVSDRAKRAAAGNASLGKPHGRVPYGYRRVYDPHTGALVAQELHPGEAPLVRELFSRVVQGHSLRGIATDFAARGVTNRSGRPFSPAQLRDMATRHSYAGLRIHDAGRVQGSSVSSRAVVVAATWPAIVPESQFSAVQQLLSDPARRTNRPGRGVHLLSMIARCAVCEGPLSVAMRGPNGSQYQCHNRGCVRVDKAELDLVAQKWIVSRLTDGAVGGPPPVNDDEVHAVRVEITRLRALLADLPRAIASGELTPALGGHAEARVEADLEDAEERLAALTAPPVLEGLISIGERAAADWVRAPMSTKREVARLLLAPGALGTLVVHPRPLGRRGGRHVMPAHERIEWRGTARHCTTD